MTATIYALCEPEEPHAIRYIGSTRVGIYERLTVHREQRKSPGRVKRNPGLAAWLQGTVPTVAVIAEVDDTERYAREHATIRELSARHDLLNMIGNVRWSRSPEVRAKISASLRAYHARRKALAG